MDFQPIQYGPSQLGEGEIQYGQSDTGGQSGPHSQRSSIGASERAAAKAALERRGERATGHAIREENNRHWDARLKGVTGNGIDVDWPHMTVAQQALDQRNRVGAGGAGGIIPNVIVLVSGTFKYCDLQGTVKGNV